MNNKLYDFLKWVAMILLPALATFYAALSGLWGFPYVLEVVGTITATDTFLGTLLALSSAKYAADPNRFQGSVLVGKNADNDPVAFIRMGSQSTDWAEKAEVKFKVETTDKVIPVEAVWPDEPTEEPQ